MAFESDSATSIHVDPARKYLIFGSLCASCSELPFDIIGTFWEFIVSRSCVKDGGVRITRKNLKSIAVVGAGSWGTAIGTWLAGNGHDVRIWDIDLTVIDDINENYCNSRYLPDCKLPTNLRGFHTLESAMQACSAVAISVPSRVFEVALRSVASNLNLMNAAEMPVVVWGTKGFDPKTGGLLSDVADRVLGDSAVYAVLSGPTFAYEIVCGLPAGTDLASASEDRVESIADLFRSERILVYTTSDLVGVQVGGATKNVIAIAAGISDGLGFGINARCLMIARGHAEINRLNIALGGKSETMMGLSGMGDLVLTCSGDLSRNRRLGLGLGQGKPLDQVLEEIGQEVEGMQSTREAFDIGNKLDVFMPITERVYRILFEGLSPIEAARELMALGPSLK